MGTPSDPSVMPGDLGRAVLYDDPTAIAYGLRLWGADIEATADWLRRVADALPVLTDKERRHLIATSPAPTGTRAYLAAKANPHDRRHDQRGS